MSDHWLDALPALCEKATEDNEYVREMATVQINNTLIPERVAVLVKVAQIAIAIYEFGYTCDIRQDDGSWIPIKRSFEEAIADLEATP